MKPQPGPIDLSKTAVIMIDMQVRQVVMIVASCLFRRSHHPRSLLSIVLSTVTLTIHELQLTISLSNFAFFAKRDFLEPGGFGAKLGNDVSKLQKAVGPCQQVLEVAREAGLLIIHTREGHRPDLTDLHPHKASHHNNHKPVVIGVPGPNGRVLVRGEPGHDIIKELYPQPGEPVVDKPVSKAH